MNTMAVTIKKVVGKKALKRFIFLPARIHAGHEAWVPPIYVDERNYFNPKKNKAFSYCDTVLMLAYRDGQPVGRIMGIINKRYNSYRKEKTARFGYLEAWEDKVVIGALLEHVEEWAREKGMERIIGPYGFTDQDPEGLMIEGFDSPSTITCYYNFDWMPGMIETFGYTKDIDYVVYRLEVPKEFPEFFQKIYERTRRKGDFKVLEFKKKKDFKKYIKPVLYLMNECYSSSDIYGYTPLEEQEMDELAARYLPLLDPRFVKGVTKGDEVVAFIIGMPNLVEGIQRAKGRLLPFGIFKILRASKKAKQLDFLLGAVKEPYRGRGLDVLMGMKMFMSAQEAGMEVIDTHHEMENNLRVRGEMERMGGVIYKRFRIYQKDLVS
jgi:GNAT superfamily N-acetyltransferase